MFLTLKDIHLLVTFLNEKRWKQETFHSTVFSNILLIEMTKISTVTFEINLMKFIKFF